MEVVSKVTGWSFLNEPLWRWFVFFGVIILFSVAWKGILSFV